MSENCFTGFRMSFKDRDVTYDKFVKDLSAKIVSMMRQNEKDPPIISQRKAWRIFGRANVERWVATDKIVPCKRPGRIEYKTAELRRLQNVAQDYF